MSDKFSVDIKDFQSLKSVHLDLPKGVTIITGKTNEGKSAVFRAIDAALFNLGDDSMIRGGQRYYGVSIDNGTHKMVFMRDGKGKNEKTAYQFDGGTVQKKVGRTQLQEVADYFNIRDVRMQNGTKMKINFWYQNDKPFLTDKTSGQLYEFLSLSSCDRYSRVLKTMKADERVIESNINSVTAEIDTLKVINNKKQDFIDSNKGFDDVYVKVVTLSQEDKKIRELDNTLQSIQQLSDRIDESRGRLDTVIKEYNKIPIEDLTSRYNTITDIYKDIELDIRKTDEIKRLDNSLQTVKKSLGDIKTSLDKSNKLEAKISKELESVTKDNDLIQSLEGTLEECDSINTEIQGLKDKIKDLDKGIFSNEKKVAKQVSQIESEEKEVSELISLVNYIEDIRGNISTLKSKLDETLKDIEKNDKDLESLKEEAGYCPYCGTVFSK